MRIRLILPVIMAVLAGGRLPAQDILFKSNGEKLKVRILEHNDRDISFRLAGQPDSTVHRISTGVLDSVLLQNGNRLLFTGERRVVYLPKAPEPVKYGRNLTGIDWSAALFFHSLAVSYERLVWKSRLGLKVVYGKDLESNIFYDNLYSNSLLYRGSYFRTGVHWYIFPPGTFRFGAGLHIITGSYHVSGERYIYNPDPPYDTTTQSVDENRNYTELVPDFMVYYQVLRNLAFNACLEIRNKHPEEYRSVLRAEVLFNF